VMDGQGAPLLPLQQGEVLAGKYRIEKVLGVGGMGAVFTATHLLLDEPVAIKVLLPTQLHRPDAAPRFLREARAASKIKSDHVARVTDVGTLDSGLPFLVMEYLEGEDLAARLQRLGPRPLPEVAGWLLQACEAMAEAHQKGIIHRDLKPSNLFLARLHDGSERVKILDFGISKVSGELSDGVLTHSRAVLGSPFYMAPEQMSSSGTVDSRVDIWSLGCVLFEALSGEPPFLADDVTILVARVLYDAHPPLGRSRPDLPPEIDAVVGRCLAKSPRDRFPDTAALAAALSPFVSSRSLPPSDPDLASRETMATLPGSAAGESLSTSTALRPAPRRGLLAVVILLLVSLGGLLGLLWKPWRSPATQPSNVSSFHVAGGSSSPLVSPSSPPPGGTPAPGGVVPGLPSVAIASVEASASAPPTVPAPVTPPVVPRGVVKARPPAGTPPSGLPHDRD
jgi:serine/threonine protein kinase